MSTAWYRLIRVYIIFNSIINNEDLKDKAILVYGSEKGYSCNIGTMNTIFDYKQPNENYNSVKAMLLVSFSNIRLQLFASKFEKFNSQLITELLKQKNNRN